MHGPDANRARYPCATLLGRIATYVVPSLAVAVTAVVLMGPGATRKATFSRIYGTPRTGMTRLALRIEGAQRLYGIDETTKLDNLVVHAREGNVDLEPASISLGRDGIGEVLITSPGPLVGPVELEVTQGQTTLVRALVPLRSDSPGKPRILAPMETPGNGTGNVRFTVSVPRGALGASYKNTLEVTLSLAEHVSPFARGFEGIRVRAEAPGARLEHDTFVTDEHGAGKLVITPYVHQVDLTLTVDDSSTPYGRSTWEGTLPIIPGAIGFEYVPNMLFTFDSPAPRQRVYVSFARDSGRLFGAVLEKADPQNSNIFFLEYRDVPPDVVRAATQVIVAGDAQEQGAGTIAWPLEPGQLVVAAPTIELLADGAKAGEERERGRAWRVRRWAILVVIATTVFEVLFMLVKSRQSQKQFEDSLMEFAQGETAADERGEPLAADKRVEALASSRQENPALRVALAVSLVLVAFSMIVALSTLQW